MAGIMLHVAISNVEIKLLEIIFTNPLIILQKNIAPFNYTRRNNTHLPDSFFQYLQYFFSLYAEYTMLPLPSQCA